MRGSGSSDKTSGPSVRDSFVKALDALVEQIKDDRSVLAAILCGSLSHDTVWRKSDIDLVLVTIDDKKVESGDRALYADGVNVHAILMPRAQFRQAVEGSIHNTFTHAFLAKGKLLYTHDETIADLFHRLADIGSRDTKIQLLGAGASALPAIDKAHKWFITRGDFEYSALFILHAATSLARVEIISAGQLADREVIPQALKLNPAFFKTIYIDLLNTKKTRDSVKRALDAVDGYIADRTTQLFGLVVEHLKDVGEARSSVDLEDHFKRHYGVTYVTSVCEYLADRGLIGKAALPVRLTKKSNVEVQELAFFYIGHRT